MSVKKRVLAITKVETICSDPCLVNWLQVVIVLNRCQFFCLLDYEGTDKFHNFAKADQKRSVMSGNVDCRSYMLSLSENR